MLDKYFVTFIEKFKFFYVLVKLRYIKKRSKTVSNDTIYMVETIVYLKMIIGKQAKGY